MTYQIAAMIPRDYDEVFALWVACEGLGAADSREEVYRFLQRNPGLSFTAWKDRAIVGAVLAGHDGRRGYLYHLAVASEHRNMGVGRALVERCIAQLSTAGIKRCSVHIYHENTAAQDFWSTIQWRQREDLTVMCKDLF